MSRIFICNFQFSQAEPPAEPRTDNRLQPVSAIAPPVTNIKQLLWAQSDLERYRGKKSVRKRKEWQPEQGRDKKQNYKSVILMVRR